MRKYIKVYLYASKGSNYNLNATASFLILGLLLKENMIPRRANFFC